MSRTGIALLTAMLVMSLAISVGAATTTATIHVEEGWNLIALPMVPINPAPESVFLDIARGDDSNIRDYLANNIIRFLPGPGGGTMNAWLNIGDWNVLLGDGYWFYSIPGIGLPPAVDMDYAAVDVSGDHWVSLPFAGYTLVGYPNNTPASYKYDDLLVTNGIQTLPLYTDGVNDAIGQGWINDIASWFDSDPMAQSMKTVAITDTLSDTKYVEAKRGYWFLTFVDNLAVIFPGS